MSTPSVIRRKVLVSGKVQGVSFRETCRLVASENGVSGSVENLDDGRVQAFFEGEENAVAIVLDWCKIGPPFARVENVEVTEEAPRGETEFVVG
jgi:acylphosphatase